MLEERPATRDLRLEAKTPHPCTPAKGRLGDGGRFYSDSFLEMALKDGFLDRETSSIMAVTYPGLRPFFQPGMPPSQTYLTR